ncbi:MAG: VOC family protein [Rhizobiales bacterium]|nr:VOC family protein [Hyphomicrobiales bacterium]
MIDHISIGVRDLAKAAAFYDAVLAVLGLVKLRTKPTTLGYGKSYPEFWINGRPDRAGTADSGLHVCLRAPSVEAVDAFHAAALRAGGASDGAPGLRPEYNDRYYAAFIVDLDGNKIEAVTFLPRAS